MLKSVGCGPTACSADREMQGGSRRPDCMELSVCWNSDVGYMDGTDLVINMPSTCLPMPGFTAHQNTSYMGFVRKVEDLL
jgi:hypothetical protein